MKSLTKIGKLRDLRKKTKDRAKLYLMNNIADVDEASAAVTLAKSRLAATEYRSKQRIVKALKSAEGVKDPSARFADLNLTLMRRHQDDAKAQGNVADAIKTQDEKRRSKIAAQSAYKMASLEFTKLNLLFSQVERSDAMVQSVHEEESLQEAQTTLQNFSKC
ncbi:MAG: hypothetical protein AAGF53_02440 [Pseudomonadota bacterium]